MAYSYDRRTVTASELHWQDISSDAPTWTGAVSLRLQATTPTGWTYRIEKFGDESFTFYEVRVSEPGVRPEYDRRAKFVHADGKAKRGVMHYKNLDDTKAAAEKHYSSVKEGWPTDPAVIAKKLTPAQKKLVLDAAENNGMIVGDYGTKSEQPYRIWLTKTRNSLSQSGLFNNWALSDLGKEVAKLLG